MTPVADGIQRIGSTQFSSTYGGEVLQPDGSINVYAVGGATPALSAALQPAVAAGAQLHYVSVAHSFASLEALTTQIAKAPLTVDGASLVSWFPDIATSKVDITLNGYTSAAAQALEDQYGSEWVTVDAVAPGQLPRRTTALSRWNDQNPFWAGDGLWFDNDKPDTTPQDYYPQDTADCTSGFGYTGKASGRNFGLTAGHCFGGPGSTGSVQTNWYTTYQLGNTSTNYFKVTDCPDECWDFASIYGGSVAYSGQVWANTTAFTVTGDTTIPEGGYLTADGANGGEVQENEVTKVDGCVDFDDGETCNLDTAVETEGADICIPDDSGGPMYQHYDLDGNVYAAGLIVGGVTGTDDTCYYHEIGPLLTKADGNLDTEPPNGSSAVPAGVADPSAVSPEVALRSIGGQ